MRIREFVFMVLILLAVGGMSVAFGWWAGRAGAQRGAGAVMGLAVGTPVDLRSGRRIRVYMGPEIVGEPAFTIVAGHVYRGSQLGRPLLTLENRRVYSGGSTAGSLLYEFDNSRVVEAGGGGVVRFVQRGHSIYFGLDPQAPVLFSFQGTRIYRGEPADGRILATCNTALTDPDLIKLVSIVLYMETLE